MQTFLPYASFSETARCLDNRRLGKQRVEVWQIFQVCRRMDEETVASSIPWSRHPAVLMWKGYEKCLLCYGLCICDEWRGRGFRDSLWGRMSEQMVDGVHLKPPWLGDCRLHSSHRSNLLRKNMEWYGSYGWSENPCMDYWWPTKNN